jgi:hypothetical protein
MAFTKTAGADRGGRRSKRDLVGQSHRAGRHFNLTARFCCRFAADAATPDRHATVCCAWVQLRTPSCGIYRPGRPPYIRVPGSGNRSRSLPSAPAKLDIHRVHPDGDEKVSTTPVAKGQRGRRSSGPAKYWRRCSGAGDGPPAHGSSSIFGHKSALFRFR